MTEILPEAREADGPDSIFLEPSCCVNWSGEGRQWCEHDVWGDDCEDHKPAVEYVRADLAREAAEKGKAELVERIAALEEDNRRLKSAHWFYLGDDCSSENCRFDISECISEDFEWDNKPVGDHVLQISGARPVPDMWVALHYFTETEKDERNDDESYTYSVHSTEDEARQALKDTQP